jgi:tripartite-type tricarboxylate transporter receptor subunit TctC
MKTLTFFAGSALLILACGAAAQYPSKPVRIIVPFPPGGGVDIVARAVGEKLAPRLSQSIVIENKPGAAMIIGTEATVKSAPDGYTLLLGPMGSQAIVQMTYRNLSFDIRRDLVPVTRIGYGTIVFVVPAGSRATSVRQLVTLAKADPGRLTFASSGTGALIHLTCEMFKQAAGIDLTHIPYKGTTQILPDLLDGRIDMTIDSLPAYLPHIRSGKVRALAVASREHSPLLPDLPTMAEAGVPGVISATDYALYAPAGVPREVVALLNREMQEVLQSTDLRAKLSLQGIEVAGSTPEAMQAELLDEFAKWSKVIRDANLKMQ